MIMLLTTTLLLLILTTVLFLNQKSFGRLPKGARLQRILQSPNYRENSFQNLEPTVMMTPDTSYARIAYEFFTKGHKFDPDHSLPSVKTDLKSLPAGPPVIVWFGHSSYFIRIDDKNILVDPVLSPRASPVQYAGSKQYDGTALYTAEDFPAIDLLIITHDHYDHLDYHAISNLKSKVTLCCTSLGVGAHLAYWGMEESKIKEFDWWQREEVLPGLELIATPARHFSGRRFARNKTLWSSFILNTSAYKIFVGGDSGYNATFKTIGEKYGPFDIAMLESGQYNKHWPNIHMMPEETLRASADLRASVLMPVHWGKFTLALHTWRDPIQRILKGSRELGINITTPMIGEPVVLGKSYPRSTWWE